MLRIPAINSFTPESIPWTIYALVSEASSISRIAQQRTYYLDQVVRQKEQSSGASLMLSVI